MIEITRRVEFDSGHRIPNHKSKCKHIHGHRYVLEATIRGPVVRQEGHHEEGMVLDFGDLKQAMQELIADQWDHAFLCSKGDDVAMRAMRAMGPDHHTVYLDFIPTVENLVAHAAGLLMARWSGPTSVAHVRLYETPNCWADWYPSY